MIRWKKNSLFVRLSVIAVAVLILFLCSVLVMNRYAKEILADGTRSTNEKLLLQVESRVVDFSDNLNRIVSASLYTPLVTEYLQESAEKRPALAEDVQQVLSNLTLVEEQIEGVYLYDRDLAQVAGLGRSDEQPRQVRDLADQIEFSNAFSAKKSRKLLYSVSAPLYDLESRLYGEKAGMCVLTMNCDRLAVMLEDAQVTAHTQLYLIDGNNRVLAREGEGERGCIPPSEITDTEEYTVQIHRLPIQGWRVVSYIPNTELYSSPDRLIGFLIAECAVAVCLMGFLILSNYRNVIVPLYRIEGFIRHIVEEPDARLESGREDEIGTIIRSLNQMLDDRDRMDREIQSSQKKYFETSLAKQRLQILAYRNQINPHFLYNTFECIRAMALYYDAEEIAEITMALSHVFRFAVKADNIVTVEDEIRYVEEYAKIIEYRFMGKIEISITAEEEVRQKQVIKLLLQPLVENAVFHGLEQKLEDGEVCISVRMSGEHELLFVVEDDGCGIEPERLSQIRNHLDEEVNRKGVGLANIYQRIRLFYGENMEFSIESTPGVGTRITIRIPDTAQEGGRVDV